MSEYFLHFAHGENRPKEKVDMSAETLLFSVLVPIVCLFVHPLMPHSWDEHSP